MSSSPEPVGAGSVRWFIGQAVDRGRAKRRSGDSVAHLRKEENAGKEDAGNESPPKPGVLLDWLVSHHGSAEVLDEAGDFAADPMVDGLLSSIIHFLKHQWPRKPELISGFSQHAAEHLHLLLPRLSAEGRRDLRATLFLTGIVLGRTSPDVITAAIDGLVDHPNPPPSIRRVVGLLGVIFYKGLLPFGDPDSTTRVCRELWRTAREGENPETVEDAWDMATLAESDLEESDPIPFVPTRAIG